MSKLVNLLFLSGSIGLIVSGWLVRKKRLKFLSIEYRGFTEIEKMTFEHEHDMDKYWNFIGNSIILAGVALLTGTVGYYMNNQTVMKFSGIIGISILVYVIYVFGYRDQYKIK